MIVKIVDSLAVAGGRAILLCDADGTPLPNQVGHRLEQSVGDASLLTVTFSIDGKAVRFEDPA